jgi:G2/mitotic-specific cyclin 2
MNINLKKEIIMPEGVAEPEVMPTSKELSHNVQDLTGIYSTSGTTARKMVQGQITDDEYLTDILKQMMADEVCMLWYDSSAYSEPSQLITMPNKKCIEMQKDIRPDMRLVLIEWLTDLHVRLDLLPETFFLSINIVDRFLSLRQVARSKFDLLGMASMFIAAKFEDGCHLGVNTIRIYANTSHAANDILRAESIILRTIDWKLHYSNPAHFLRIFNTADGNADVLFLATSIVEVAVQDWRLVSTRPSLLTVASIWLARLALGLQPLVSY